MRQCAGNDILHQGRKSLLVSELVIGIYIILSSLQIHCNARVSYNPALFIYFEVLGTTYAHLYKQANRKQA
jgi:hypothetical protein